MVIEAPHNNINVCIPSLFATPRAYNDGNGTVTIFKALRVLPQVEDVTKSKALNMIELHWYSAEEEGLLRSQAIVSSHVKKGQNIKRALQQAMTGYVPKSLSASKPEGVGMVMDLSILD